MKTFFISFVYVQTTEIGFYLSLSHSLPLALWLVYIQLFSYLICGIEKKGCTRAREGYSEHGAHTHIYNLLHL